jgi:uncharacterized repeat protein (TIGR01451 family)
MGLVSHRVGHGQARLNRNRPQIEHLEDRTVPAVVTYTSVSALLDFTADAGDADKVTVTAPAANQVVIQVGNSDAITLAGDAASNVDFTLSTTATANDTLTINTGPGHAPAANFNINLGDQGDSLTLGLLSAADGVSNVAIDGGTGTNSATLNGGSVAETIGVSATQVTRSDGSPVSYSGFASLTVNGTDQADTVNVAGTAAGTATTVNGGGGLDSFGPINQTTIAAAGLTVNGGGQVEALTLNGSAAAETIGVSATQVTRSSGGPVAYAGLASVTVNGTGQGDTINVTSTASGVSTTVNAEGGNDTVRVGNTSDGLGDLAGALTIDGGGQAGDALTLDDQKSSSGHTYGVSAAGVTRDGTSVLNFSNFASLTLDASDQADTINVASTASGLGTTVNAGGGNDAVNVGNSTNGLGDLAGALTVDGGGQSSDALMLTDQKAAAGHTYDVSSTSVNRDSSSVLGYSNFASLMLRTSDQADTINVTSTASGTATTVNAGGGLDTFGAIDQTTIAAAGLTVNGGGQGEALTLNGGSTGETIGVSATQVSRSDGGPVTYSGVATLTVNGTGQADHINVTATASGVSTTVNAGGGNDAVNVGNSTNGLGDLAGALTVDGGGQSSDALMLTDQKAAAGHAYDVSSTSVNRDSSSVLGYSNFASLMLRTSDQADTINVNSTASGTATAVDGGDGGDTYSVTQNNVGSAGLSIADTGSTGTDSLTVSSTASGPETITVSGSLVTRSNSGNVTVSGIEALLVSGTDNATGDSFDVTPSASVAITIDGKNPTTAPGDTLNYSGTAGLVNAVDANDGTITDAGFQPVTYKSIETITGNSSLLLVLDAGAQANDGIPDSFLIRGNGGTFDAFVNGSLAFTGQTSYYHNIIINGSGDNDFLSVDATDGNPIPKFGINFNAGGQTDASGDQLEVIDRSTATGGYLPGGTAGTGTFNVNTGAGDRPIIFNGLESATAHSLSDLTLTTPGSKDVLTVDSPTTGQNRVQGTTDGVAITPLTFFDVTNVTVDTGANDGSQPDDSLTIGASDLVASGLTSFVFKGGPGNDQLSLLGTNYATPGSSSGLSFQGGAGINTFVGGGDTSFTLQDSGVTSSAGGRVQFSQVQVANLTGGASNNTFVISGWTGTGRLTGAGGTADRVVDTAGSTFTLSDNRLTVAGRADMVLAGIEVADLAGGAGTNSFDISGWTGTGSLTGSGNPTSQVVATADADFTLSDTQLTISGRANMTLTRIFVANLTGGAGANTFTVSGWTGTANVDGGLPTTTPGDTLNVDITGAINPELTATHTANGFAGSYTFDNRQPVNFSEIETLSPAPSDLSVSKLDSPDPVLAGANLTYTITVRNTGLLVAGKVTLTDALPANTTFVSFTAPAGWTTSTPTVGGTGSVTATLATLPASSGPQLFTLVVRVNASTPDATTLSNTATVAATTADADPSNNQSTAMTTVHHASILVVGMQQNPSGDSQVRVLDARTGTQKFILTPYVNYAGEVRVAVGDVNGDGVPDIITGAGSPGSGSHVKVFDGKSGTEIASFLAFPGFPGGVSVASGDFHGDGFSDIIVATNAGGNSHVKVIDGTRLNQVNADGGIADSALLGSFYAYSGFDGEVRVAAEDVNGDGKDDIITGTGPGVVPHVKVIDGTRLGRVNAGGGIADSALLASFFAYSGFTGGVFVAAGDVNGDGKADIITGAGPGADPHVKVVDATRLGMVNAAGAIADAALLASFDAEDSTFSGGIRVAATDHSNSGVAQVATTPGPGPVAQFNPRPAIVSQVRIFSGTTAAELDSFFAFDPTFSNGAFVGGRAR